MNSIKLPGTVADDASVGIRVWSNPDNVKTQNGVRATASANGADITHFIKCTNFGFAIPSNSIINGVSVRIRRNSSEATYSFKDYILKLIKGGAYSGNNKANTVTKWGSTWDAEVTYGNSTDLWGNTLSASDINSSDFGVGLSAQDNGGSGVTAYVDVIEITVSYTLIPPSGGFLMNFIR